MKKIGIVEDNEDMQLLYKIILRRIPEVQVVSQPTDAEEAENAFKAELPDLVIIDITLPGKSGVDFARELRNKYPRLKILVATGHDPDAFYSVAMDAGADDFIMKGDTAQILQKIKKLLQIP